MVKRFVFFVNAAYCYPIFRPIQDAIRQKGHEVAWFFTKDVEPKLLPNECLLHDEQAVKNYAPDAMFGASDWIPHYLPGLKVMVFHGLSINKRGTQRNAHYRVRGWYDLYCTHAEEDTRIFSELAEQHRHFRVVKTGWPKLDPLFHRQHVSVKNESLKTLFFASTFSHSITAAPYVINVLREIARSGNWRVLATLHPLMNQETIEIYRESEHENFIFLAADDDLYGSMLQADVMLCDTSSIMYEFMFLNKPVVTYKSKTPGPFVKNVQEEKEILPAIEDVLINGKEQLLAAKEVCERLHSFNDGKSSERVLTAALQAIELGGEGLRPKPRNFFRKLKLRKMLGYWGP